MFNDLRHRVRALFRRQAVEDELAQELAFHLEEQTRKLVEQGMTSAEAARQARIALGGVEQVKEEHRQARGIDLVETTLQDIRYGLRSLRRNAGFTITALLTLALNTGTVSSVLCLANAIAWRRMPVPRPDRLVAVSTPQGKPTWGRVSYVDYLRLRDHTTTLQGLAAHVGGFAPFWATYAGRAGELNGAIVSGNAFTVLGLQPAHGRFFSPDEDRVADRDRIAVISHRLWREAWNGSPEVLGAAVQIYGVAFTVIGVAPQGFHGIVAQRADVYIPTAMLRVLGIGCDPFAAADCATLGVIGRLRDDRTFAEAAAEIPTLAPPLKLNVVQPRGAWGAMGGQRLRDWPDGRPLLAVAACCLLLGCANLAGLLVARGSGRARELAIRPSLGATPLRLLRQLMTESLLLAVGGGLLGLGLAAVLTRLYLAAFYEQSGGRLSRYDASPDGLVIALAVAVSVGTAFLFGLLPAWKSIQQGAALALSRQASSPPSHRRLTRVFIATQVAGALALVTLTALLASSYRRFVTDAHFDPARVAILRLTPGFGATSKKKYTWEKAEALHRGLMARMSQVPDVVSLSLFTGNGPLISGWEATVSRPGQGALAPVRAGWQAVGPGFFAVLRVPLRKGRDFDERDVRGAPRVAIVSEALAHRLWPNGDALGSTLVANEDAPEQVVGIVADITASTASTPALPHVYRPYWQQGDVNARYCVRVQGDPTAVLPALVRTVAQTDPEVAVRETMSMEAFLAGEDLQALRLTATIAGFGALLALLLCGVGLYGTLAFVVARRTREIGVRVAVGAGPREVVALVLREEMRTVLLGMVAGAIAAWMASQLVRHLLYGAAARDVAPYVAAVFVVTAAALCACWLPSRRAARLDPMTALRVD